MHGPPAPRRRPVSAEREAGLRALACSSQHTRPSASQMRPHRSPPNYLFCRAKQEAIIQNIKQLVNAFLPRWRPASWAASWAGLLVSASRDGLREGLPGVRGGSPAAPRGRGRAGARPRTPLPTLSQPGGGGPGEGARGPPRSRLWGPATWGETVFLLGFRLESEARSTIPRNVCQLRSGRRLLRPLRLLKIIQSPRNARQSKASFRCIKQAG